MTTLASLIRTSRRSLRDDPQTSWPLARVLAEHGDPRAVPLCLEVLRTTADDERSGQAFAAVVGLGAGAVPHLVELLGSPEGEGVNKVVRALLVEIGSPAVPNLIPALGVKKTAPEVIPLLAELRDPRTVEPLQQFVRNGRPRSSRASAVRALGSFPDPTVYKFLIEATYDQDKEIRRAGVDALGLFANEQAVPRLRELLLDRDGDVRWSAVVGVCELGGGKESVEDLVTLIRDHDADAPEIDALPELTQDANPDEASSAYRAAYSAAKELANLGEPGIEALLELTEDTNPRVRQFAYAGFSPSGHPVEITDERIIRRLAAAVADKPAARWAAGSLHACRSRLAADLLFQYLSDPDPDVRGHAVAGLGVHSDGDVVEALIHVLGNDPDPGVRASAARGLLKIHPPTAEKPLLDSIAHDRAEAVRMASREALKWVRHDGRAPWGYNGAAPSSQS